MVTEDLQDAARRASGGKLSATTYDRVRRTGSLSSSRIVQRYGGSWITVCLAAHVRSGGRKHREYRSTFTLEECRQAVRTFMAEGGKTYAGYVRWAQARKDMPSGQTVRNGFGRWSDAVDASLMGE